jgi:hypothetical protein
MTPEPSTALAALRYAILNHGPAAKKVSSSAFAHYRALLADQGFALVYRHPLELAAEPG